MNCLFDPARVVIRVTINKLYFVPGDRNKPLINVSESFHDVRNKPLINVSDEKRGSGASSDVPLEHQTKEHPSPQIADT